MELINLKNPGRRQFPAYGYVKVEERKKCEMERM